MENVINVKYPRALANSMRLNQKDFEKEVKLSSMVKLFEIGKVSSGTAANVLGLSRVDFLELLPRYNVSIFNYENYDELIEDLNNA